jgi:hypothetical protein
MSMGVVVKGVGCCVCVCWWCESYVVGLFWCVGERVLGVRGGVCWWEDAVRVTKSRIMRLGLCMYGCPD